MAFLEGAMNGDRGEFLGIDGLEGIRYLPKEGSRGSVGGATVQIKGAESRALSGSWIAGIVLLSVGSVALIVVASMLALRKRKGED